MKKKTFAVIGLGKFGYAVAETYQHIHKLIFIKPFLIANYFLFN